MKRLDRLKRKDVGRQAWLASLREWNDLKVSQRAARAFVRAQGRGLVGAVVFDRPLDTGLTDQERERERADYQAGFERFCREEREREQRSAEAKRKKILRQRMGFRQPKDVL